MGADDQSSNEETTPRTDEWMLKPCVLYKDEYDHCTSFQSRVEQYYVFGRLSDCSQWKRDYENCFIWQKYKSDKAYEELLQSEKTRKAERLNAHYANDVWQRRDRPPDNWTKPLEAEANKKSTSNVEAK